MASVLTVILPIFAVILAGYLCHRLNVLGASAASEINRMVVWLCLPALLFEAMATSRWDDIWQPSFILSFGLATLGLFAIVLIWNVLRHGKLADASVRGLSASYANTGYMGIPLCLLVFGDAGMEPALIASLIIICVLFAFAVICIEIGLQNEPSIWRAAAGVCLALVKNPVVIAPVLGGLWASTSQPLPESIHQFLKMLAAATGPCALVSLGLFLAHKHQGTPERGIGLVLLKLIAHPALTWLLAVHVFHLPAMWVKAAVLLSALPTGTGPFMLAEFYSRDGAQVSSTILLSTFFSLLTLSGYLYFIGN